MIVSATLFVTYAKHPLIQGTVANKFYVHNDIFRYQDEVFGDSDSEPPEGEPFVFYLRGFLAGSFSVLQVASFISYLHRVRGGSGGAGGEGELARGAAGRGGCVL